MTSAIFSTSKRINEMYRPESRTVSLSKSPFGSFAKLPSKLQNVFCSSVLQFCRCGGLFDAKGHPDGFLSHFSSLRNLRLGSFFASPFRKNEMYRPASRTVSLSKSPFGSFAKLPSKLQNVFCSSVLQFCRCGGLFDAKGHPDGFLSLFSSLRNLRLIRFFDTQTQKRNVPPGKPDGTFRRKERKREKKEKKHEKERGCDLWKTSDQGRVLSCSDGSSALADVVGSSSCTASSLLSNTMGRRNVLP